MGSPQGAVDPSRPLSTSRADGGQERVSSLVLGGGTGAGLLSSLAMHHVLCGLSVPRAGPPGVKLQGGRGCASGCTAWPLPEAGCPLPVPCVCVAAR